MTVLSVVIALATVIGGIVVGLELLLRLLALVNEPFAERLRAHDLLAVKIVPLGEYGYRQRPRSAIRYLNETVATSNALGYRGPEVPVVKPPGTIRIVMTGGSSAYGWGVQDDETIDEYMRREFAAQYPARRVEVLNLACDGYDSLQDHERIRLDGLRFSPDVVILHSGINDVRNARFDNLQDHDPRTLLWRNVIDALRAQQARGRPAFRTLIKHWSYLARLLSMIRDMRAQDARAAQRATETVAHPEAVENYERNVRRTAWLCAEHGIATILSSSPSSIPTKYAPDSMSPRDYWIRNAVVTQQVRERLTERMRRVASEVSDKGHAISHVEHSIAPEMFLDDAHLTPEGNAAIARRFVAEVARLLHLERESTRPQPETFPNAASRPSPT